MMNNLVFGKTMENIRNRVNIQIATIENLEKLVSKPTLKGRNILSANLTLVHLGKMEMKMNKPIYVGQAILDISKTLMYDFHYNFIKEKYGEKAKLLFTDTDSLFYEIETENFYDHICADVLEKFDTPRTL